MGLLVGELHALVGRYINDSVEQQDWAVTVWDSNQRQGSVLTN
jgi:hypothetical protein